MTEQKPLTIEDIEKSFDSLGKTGGMISLSRQTFDELKNQIIKETIEAVLPKEKEPRTGNVAYLCDVNYNLCRDEIIKNAKEKFGIEIK